MPLLKRPVEMPRQALLERSEDQDFWLLTADTAPQRQRNDRR